MVLQKMIHLCIQEEITLRSFYLDDMDVQPGDKVVCKAAIAADWLSVNAVYIVVAFGVIRAMNGDIFKFPSARFQKVTE